MVMGVLSVISAIGVALISTRYEMSGSTPVMSKVGGAFHVRRITLVRFALVRLLTAAGLPEKIILG